MVKERAHPSPDAGLKQEDDGDDKEAELKAGLPKLKAIDGEDYKGGGEEVIENGGAAK